MVSFSTFSRFCILSFGFLSATALAGQKPALVYFESETHLPFTLTWNNQTYVSDPKGVLEIRDIPEGEHSFQIDLGKYHGTASRFALRLGDDSRAFAVRQLLDNRIQLFNLITYGLTTGTSMPLIKPVLVYQNPLTGFSKGGQKNQLPPDNGEAPKMDTRPKTSIAQATVHGEITTLPVPSAVKKVFDQTGSDGIDQIYVLSSEGKTDTVALFIPVLQVPASKQAAGPGSKENSVPVKQKTQLPAAERNQPVRMSQSIY